MASDKKKARREGRVIVFIDESGVSLESNVVRTWAPKGQPVVLRQPWGHREKLSIIAAVSAERLFFRIYEQAIHAEQVVEFLKQLEREVGAPLLVVWDGISTHRAAVVKAYLRQRAGRIWVERLPAYAPELNPVEYAWGRLKQLELPNLQVDAVPALQKKCQQGLRRMSRRSELVASFWQQAELAL